MFNRRTSQLRSIQSVAARFIRIVASNCPNLATVNITGLNIMERNWGWWYDWNMFDFSNNPSLTEASIDNILSALISTNARRFVLNLRNTRTLTNSQLNQKATLLGRSWIVLT